MGTPGPRQAAGACSWLLSSLFAEASLSTLKAQARRLIVKMIFFLGTLYFTLKGKARVVLNFATNLSCFLQPSLTSAGNTNEHWVGGCHAVVPIRVPSAQVHGLQVIRTKCWQYSGCLRLMGREKEVGVHLKYACY